MKRRIRRTLFYLSVLVFLALGFLVVLYALGYKYDFVQSRFLKTGSLEMGVNVEAEIYINDEFAGTTSFLSRVFSKSRLLPRTYSVRLQNEQYQSWQKLVSVEAGFFSSFPRIVLVPRELNEEIIASSSLDGITSVKFDPQNKTAAVSNGRQMETIYLENGRKELSKSPPKIAPSPLPTKGGVNLIKSPDGEKNAWFNDHEIWVGWLKDTNYQPYRKTGEIELITRFSQKISDIQWYKDSDHLIADIGGILKFIEIDTRDGINIFDISTVDSPFYYDKGSDVIFKFIGNKLVKISLK